MNSILECYTKPLLIGSLNVSINLCVEIFKFILVLLLAYGIGQVFFVYFERYFPSLCDCRPPLKKTPFTDCKSEMVKVWRREVTDSTATGEEVNNLWKSEDMQEEQSKVDSSTESIYNNADEQWWVADFKNVSSSTIQEDEGTTGSSKKIKNQHILKDFDQNKIVNGKMEKVTQTESSWRKSHEKSIDLYRRESLKEILPNYLKTANGSSGFDVSTPKTSKKSRGTKREVISPSTKRKLIEEFDSNGVQTSKKVQKDKSSKMMPSSSKQIGNEFDSHENSRSRDRRTTQDYLRGVPVQLNTSQSTSRRSHQKPQKERLLRGKEANEFRSDEVVISKSVFVNPDFTTPKKETKRAVDDITTYSRKSAPTQLERYPNGDDLKSIPKKRDNASDTWDQSTQLPSLPVSQTSTITKDKDETSTLKEKYAEVLNEMDKLSTKPKYSRKSANARLETHPSEDDLRGMTKLRHITSDAWDQYGQAHNRPVTPTPSKAREDKVSPLREDNGDEHHDEMHKTKSAPKTKKAIKSVEESDKKVGLDETIPKPGYSRKSAQPRLETYSSDEDIKVTSKLRRIASDARNQTTQTASRPLHQKSNKIHEDKVLSPKRKYDDKFDRNQPRTPVEARLETRPDRIASDALDASTQSSGRTISKRANEDKPKPVRGFDSGEKGGSVPKSRHHRKSAEAKLQTHRNEDNVMRSHTTRRFASETLGSPSQSMTRPISKKVGEDKVPLARAKYINEFHSGDRSPSTSRSRYSKKTEDAVPERRSTQVELKGTPKSRRFTSATPESAAQSTTRRRTG